MSEEYKVRLWIWGGFGFVLLLLAVVGGISYVSFNEALDHFKASERTGKATVNVLSGFRDLTSMRRYGLVYLDSGNEHALKRVEELNSDINKEFDNAFNLSIAAERREAIKRLHELSTSLYTRLQQAVILRAEKLQKLAGADAIGHNGRSLMDQFAKAYHADSLISEPMETLMRSRLELARFSGHPTDELSKKMIDLGTTYAKLAKEFSESGASDRQAKGAEITASADTYLDALKAASESALEMAKITDEVMEAIGKEISSLGVKLVEMQSKRQEQISEEVEGFIFNTKVTIGTLTLVAILIAIACALLVSAKVSRPIATMATAARVAEEIGELIKLAAQDGDFRNRTPTEGRTGFVATISEAVNKLFDTVCAAFDSISRDAGKVALAASDASGAVVEVNAGAAEQARSLEQVREAIRMSAEAITKVSSNSTSAASVADRAKGLANRGQITIAEMADRMESGFRNSKELVGLSESLNHTVAKVDFIAASIKVEVMKLGEQGRDMADVCQDAVTLTKDAHEYSTKIKKVVEATNNDLQAGSLAAGSARQLIDDIHHHVVETDGMIRLIAETMLAQQSAILEIDATTNSLAEIGEHNVEAGEQISRRLVELRDISGATKAAIAAFRIEQAA